MDLTDPARIEKVDVKKLDPLRKSYVVENVESNGLKRKLETYRDQLLGYNKSSPTPINVLDIQLTGRLTFEQDVVFRAFMKESLENYGVMVEVSDYKSRASLMKPPVPRP